MRSTYPQPAHRIRSSGNGGRGLPFSPRGVEIAEQTGPLDRLVGQRAVVIADVQNIDGGARDLGFKVSWRALGDLLDQGTCRASRHAVLSTSGEYNPRLDYFAARGWKPYTKYIRDTHTQNGRVSTSNADHLLAFLAGVLISRTRADRVVLASGDGDLVEDIAEGVLNLPGVRAVLTLSLAGSTARRLDATRSSLISDNIEIGLDCLHPYRRHLRVS